MRSRMAAMTSAGLLVGERRPRVVVVGGEDEDLVDAAGGGLGEDRATVVDHEGVVALEGGIEVGDHPHQPVALEAVGLEGGRGRLLVARAERARAAVSAWTGGPGGEAVGRLARSMLTTTQRPVRGSRRSWFICCVHIPSVLDG